MRSRQLFLVLTVLWVCALTSNCQADQSISNPTPRPAETSTSVVIVAPDELPSAKADSTPAGESLPLPQEEPNDFAGLPFDEFLEESYHQLMVRDPETITELGLDAAFGMPGDQLTNISDTHEHETYALIVEIQTQLFQYDRQSLTPEQQLSYDIYAWYLDDLLRGQKFMYNNLLVSHYFVTAVQYQTLYFFTDIQPVTDKQTAENYITRLSQIDEKFAQAVEGLQLCEQAGVIPPRFSLEWAMEDLNGIVNSPATFTPFYTSFKQKVNDLDNLSGDEKATLLEAAETKIETSVIPAFGMLAGYVTDLIERAPTDVGVWQYPNGRAYYEYLVRHHTTTEMTPDEIHQLGFQELERIHSEMQTIFSQLGYPEDESLPQLFERVAQDSGSLQGDEIVAEYEVLIEAAEEQVKPVFGLQPNADVVVIGVPRGGFYVRPAVDGSRPGTFYATATGIEPKFSMPTLAYHEAVPGHHTQIAIALELDLPDFRKGGPYTAYSEGWALYAEHLMAELGVYESDPYGDLGRLQAEAFRAARLVVDTGIHAKGWSYEQAVDFMIENTGMSQQQMEFEVARYIVWPGQALAYKIGMIKILELRQLAEDQLGDQYNLTEFHNVVLGNGAVPLDILEQIVETYIAACQSS
jgi:uncharacterized protein (DUF885 family)